MDHVRHPRHHVGRILVRLLRQADRAAERIIKEGRRARTTFWQSPNLRDGANKLDKNGAYRQIVDDGLLAEEQHNKLTDPDRPA